MSKELYSELEKNDLLNYGSFIKCEFVREILGIQMPEIATKREFDKISLQEIAAIDYVRNILINNGKYIKGENDGYRVLLPSENAGQVENYMSSADKKLRRAIKLAKSTPKEFTTDKCNNTVRLHLKRESIKNERRKNDLM
jgi:hypothetical protein